MGLDSITLFDFDQRTEMTQSFMQAFTLGKKNLPPTSNGSVKVVYKTHQIHFYMQGLDRILEFNVQNFHDNNSLIGKITLSDSPDESMVIATPFDKPKYFYFFFPNTTISSPPFVKSFWKSIAYNSTYPKAGV